MYAYLEGRDHAHVHIQLYVHDNNYEHLRDGVIVLTCIYT